MPAEGRPPQTQVFLTVEEAGAYLRVGRTKAYAMTREWRATDGRSGLPVRDLGGLLRVPVDEFEQRFGIRLTAAAWPAPPQVGQPETPPTPPATKPRRRRAGGGAQLGLFNPEG